MNHLTPDEQIDATDGTLDQARRAHLAECSACRAEVAQLQTLLGEVRALDVPEPSPMAWQRWSAQLNSVLSAEALPSRSLSPIARWFQWPVLVPAVGLAVIVLALAWSVPQPASEKEPVEIVVSVDEVASEPLVSVDSSWEIIEALVGDADVEAAEDAGLTASLGSAEQAVAELTAAEQVELLRLLREELQRPGEGPGE